MKLALLTICIGETYKNLWKSANLSKKIYCEKNGYDFILIDSNLDSKRKPHWSKIKGLINNIDRYDWIFHSDADAHIMNMSIKLEDIINKYSNNAFMIITNDKNMLNSGNFFIKNSRLSKYFLEDCYKAYPPKPIKIGKNTMMLNDQYAIYLNSLKENYNKLIKIIPQRVINAYPCACCGQKYIAGDFLIHFVNNRLPTHNWDGKSKEPYLDMNIQEARTLLHRQEKYIKGLQSQLHKLNN